MTYRRLIGDGRTWSQRLHLRDRAVEWLSAAFMLSWATMLALPGDSLAGPGYAAFHRFGMTEVFWTWVFAGVGTGRMVALAINGALNPATPIIRMLGSMIGAVSWAQVTILVIEGTWMITGIPIPGTGVYAILAVVEVVNTFQAALDVRSNSA